MCGIKLHDFEVNDDTILKMVDQGFKFACINKAIKYNQVE